MSMMKGLRTLFIVSLIGILIAFFWDHLPSVKSAIHTVLDPSLGALLDWNVSWGILIVSLAISLITSLLQKYMTDQETLKSIRAEQKLIGDQMKEFKDHPEKLLELQRKQMPLLGKSMELTMRPTLYTAVPFIILIRWFGDYFADHSVKIFGLLSWLWAYILFAILFSLVFRKVFKLA